MGIRRAGYEDETLVAPLVAGFRVALSALKGIQKTADVRAAGVEFQEYLNAGYPIFLCEVDQRAAGYLVCRVDSGVVWVESIYVSDAYRRMGIAGRLYDKAEELAAANGEETLYNYVHPNNDAMIAFLKSRGYDVLNLIEIRKPRTGDKNLSDISVGIHVFQY